MSQILSPQVPDMGSQMRLVHTRYLPIAQNGKTRVRKKFSSASMLYGRNEEMRRWTWGRIKLSTREDPYDRLILVGEKDIRFADKYRDKSSRHVIFDIPAKQLPRFVSSGGTSGLVIQLPTDPDAVRTDNIALFKRYQITETEYFARYGLRA